MIIAFAGGAVVAYPLASPWLADVIHGDAVAHYESSTGSLSAAERERLLDEAHAYNEALPNGPLRDPYIINASGEAVSLEEGRGDYERQLRVDPDDSRAAMARLTIPAIDVDLPIFHGTSEETLSRGVGHFYGSGLPVGGDGVHSVLTAHSGLVEAKLFDDLPQLVVGDTFSITVLGTRLTYEVDNIATVLPDDSSLLRQVPGEDYVTLVTCTPRYVNTHRLLVRGTLIDSVELGDGARASDEAVGTGGPGIPWWVLLVIAPPLGAFLLVRPR